MEIYDITLPIHNGALVWPGDPPVSLERLKAITSGAEANVSRLSLGVHTGTHVDAPDHFLDDGQTVESLSLEVLTGPALVVRVPDEIDCIMPEVLDRSAIPAGTQRILFKTRNSACRVRGETAFDTAFVAVSVDAAGWLIERGVRLVGVDYLSVAPYGESVPTHRRLLEAGVVIVEGLDLGAVEPGAYELYCLPLKLKGVEGAPAREILIR